MSLKEKLVQLSSKTGLSLEEIQRRLETIKKERNLKDIQAYQVLRGELRRESGTLFSPAEAYTGIIFGDTGVLDFIEIMRQRAISMYENPATREIAIARGYVDSRGTPLDTRRIVDFQENPNYLKPLRKDEHSYHRVLYGVANKGGSLNFDEADFFRLTIDGENCLDLAVPLFIPVTFRANKRRRSLFQFLDLNAPRSFKVSFNILGEERTFYSEVPEILYRSSLLVVPLSELDSVLEAHSKQDRREIPPILTEGYVASISYRESSKYRVLILDDEDLGDERGVTAFIDPDFPIYFGLDSRIIVVGEVGSFQGDDERIFVRAYGYYPIPELLITG